MSERRTLGDFPCVTDIREAIWYEHHCEQVPPNPCPIAAQCALRPVYEEYLRLQAAVDANEKLVKELRSR